MNRKDIAHLRNQLKLNSSMMQIKDIFNVYIRKETSEIFYEESQPFEMLDQEQQQLFLTNFKKVLSGKLDAKLFNVKFTRSEENSTQHILHDSLKQESTAEWKDSMLLIVEKMLEDVQYDSDIVITFIRGRYTRRSRDTNEETATSGIFNEPFIICSINKTEQPENSLLFDYVELQFKANIAVDPIINLLKPIGGFLFPTFSDGYVDVNHIIYAAKKANEPDLVFISDVLNGEEITTAKEDKIIFEEVVKEVLGEEVDTEILANVYEEINDIITDEDAEEEDMRLDYKDVERVLSASGAEDINEYQVEMAFKKVIADEKYEFKAPNVIPNYTTKSVKINTKVANITISPKDLKYVKQVNINGKRCLLIEVDDDAEVESFKLISELEELN